MIYRKKALAGIQLVKDLRAVIYCIRAHKQSREDNFPEEWPTKYRDDLDKYFVEKCSWVSIFSDQELIKRSS